MLSPHAPRKNVLLAALPEEEYERIRPHLDPVLLTVGDVVYDSGASITHVLFPTSAIVSLLYTMEDGATGEIALVGNEGVVGVPLFMGGESTPSQAVVQSAGVAFRLSGKILKQEFARALDLQQNLLRYTQALLTQMAQTAVCNRHHTVEKQLCRWLLLTLDRLPSNELSMTQEMIANMLGVRREGVTEAARKLKVEGLISYRRGRIVVNDRAGLEARCCECYEVVRREYARLLPDPG